MYQMENENNSKNKIVETYIADMASAVDGSEGIFIRKIIEEQEKKEERYMQFSLGDTKNKIFLYVGLFLLFAALGALGFLVFSKTKAGTVEVAQQYIPAIYLDNYLFKDIEGIAGDQIHRVILTEAFSKEIKFDEIFGVYLTLQNKIIGLRKFLSLTSPELDQKNLAFVDDNFLIGATNIENKEIFILIKTRSFSDVFDFMRLWENKMFYDLKGVFDIEVSSETNYLLTKDFEDGIVQNKNARILKDKDGKTVMMYVFIDDRSLLITKSNLVAKEVGLRLSSGILRK